MTLGVVTIWAVLPKVVEDAIF
ncbi:hypothetical protein EMIT07CA2_120130 [Brevibacillus sp. IT-7CA2]